MLGRRVKKGLQQNYKGQWVDGPRGAPEEGPPTQAQREEAPSREGRPGNRNGTSAGKGMTDGRLMNRWRVKRPGDGCKGVCPLSQMPS